jgi:hypothetical protein
LFGGIIAPAAVAAGDARAATPAACISFLRETFMGYPPSCQLCQQLPAVVGQTV